MDQGCFLQASKGASKGVSITAEGNGYTIEPEDRNSPIPAVQASSMPLMIWPEGVNAYTCACPPGSYIVIDEMIGE